MSLSTYWALTHLPVICFLVAVKWTAVFTADSSLWCCLTIDSQTIAPIKHSVKLPKGEPTNLPQKLLISPSSAQWWKAGMCIVTAECSALWEKHGDRRSLRLARQPAYQNQRAPLAHAHGHICTYVCAHAHTHTPTWTMNMCIYYTQWINGKHIYVSLYTYVYYSLYLAYYCCFNIFIWKTNLPVFLWNSSFTFV